MSSIYQNNTKFADKILVEKEERTADEYEKFVRNDDLLNQRSL